MLNKDDECFKWAVTRALNPVPRDQPRVIKLLRKQASRLNWEGISFPVTFSNEVCRRFEENNEQRWCLHLRVPGRGCYGSAKPREGVW